jgi:hypothetical protein
VLVVIRGQQGESGQGAGAAGEGAGLGLILAPLVERGSTLGLGGQPVGAITPVERGGHNCYFVTADILTHHTGAHAALSVEVMAAVSRL